MTFTISSIKNRFKGWIASLSQHQVLSVTVHIAILTAFTKVFFLVKDLLVADAFGTSDDLDAFLIACVVPTFVLNILTGQFGSALIPIYMKIKNEEGRESGFRFLGDVTVRYALFLILVMVIVALCSPLYLPTLASGFSGEKAHLTNILILILAINIVMNGVSVLWRVILNAEHVFTIPTLSAACAPLGMIIFLVLLPNWDAYSLALGMVLGSLIEIVSLGINMLKKGIPMLPRSIGASPHLPPFYRQYGLLVGGASLLACTDLIDQSMAASLPAGSVSALSYGTKLPLVPISLFIMALGTAVLLYASKAVATQSWNELRRMISRNLVFIFAVTVPFTILFVLFSEEIIHIVFERGAFSSADTRAVAFVQSLYVIQIPFFIANVLITRIIFAMQANRIYTVVAGLTLAAKIGMNLAFIQNIGAAGIALSTSLMYALGFVLNLIFLLRRIDLKRKEALEPVLRTDTAQS